MHPPGNEPRRIIGAPGRQLSSEEARQEPGQRGASPGSDFRSQLVVSAVRIAPGPRLTALEGRDYRMRRLVEMLECVPVFRILAASDVATGKTYTELVPGCSDRETALATVRARRYLPKVAEMLTRLGHSQVLG